MFRPTSRLLAMATLCWLAAIVAACPVPTRAAGPEELGLRQAIQQALADNHSLRAGAQGLAAMGEDVGVARSMLLPKLTFEERFMRTTNPVYGFMAKLNEQRFGAQDFAIPALNSPDALNDYQTSFSLEQPLFAPQANIGLTMSRNAAAAGRHEFDRKKEEVVLQVAQAFLMVRTATSYTEVAEKGRHDAEEHARIAGHRYENGLGLYSDTLRATTAVTEAEQRLVSAKKNLDVAQRALGMLLGLEQSVTAATEDGLDLPVADLARYTDAGRQRRDLLAMQLRQSNASQNVKLAKAGYLPNIGVGATYQLNDHDQPFGGEGESWQVGAFLKWQLFNGMGREHERSKALYQKAAADEYLHAMEMGVSYKVYEAYRGVEEAGKNAELAQAALKTAEEGARLVEVRYENGLSPMVDLLDAQLSLDHARAMTVASKNNYRIAVFTLCYESGTIFQDLGINESSPEEQE